MLFGSYGYPDVSLKGVPGVTATRLHLYQFANGKLVWPSVNGPIPARWPATPAGITGFYTIYPNPDQLLAGKLDAAIRQFVTTAPVQGGVLTAYAEADADWQHGGQFAPLGLTKAKLAAVHRKMHALCAGTKVKYGCVVCGTVMDQVSFAVPGMDFYGLDWYDTWAPDLLPQLNTFRRNVGAIQVSPYLAIAETNSNIPARRPFWFSAIYGWLAGYSVSNGGRGLGFWSYWRLSGTGLSGPWLPGDSATITALGAIAADAART